LESLSTLFQKREIAVIWRVCLLSSRREKSQGYRESDYSLPEERKHREMECLSALFQKREITGI
jgi:hypothetical protein